MFGRFFSSRARKTAALVTAAVVITPGIVFATPIVQAAVGDCTKIAGFEIDGNMVAPTCTGIDWQSVSPSISTQGGTYKTAGKDDDNDTSTWQSSGSTPPKSDFEEVYAITKVTPVNNTDHYVGYVAWTRDATSGSGTYAIEFTNAGTHVAADGTPQPNRNDGGYVIFLDFNGGSLPQESWVCHYTSPTDYPGTCTDTPPSSAFATGINTGSIQNTVTGGSEDPGAFFEVGIDFTALFGIAPGCPPVTDAAAVYVRSMTGNNSVRHLPKDSHISANLKAYMAPLAVSPPTTCTTPDIATEASGNGAVTNGVAGVPYGSSQTDTVTVTGPAGFPTPQGRVTYFICTPSQVTTDVGCAPGKGTQVGSPVVLNQDPPPVYHVPNTAGKYCWRVEYNPVVTNDANPYNPSEHTNFTTECFTVIHATPTITTTSNAVTVSPAAANSLGFTTLQDSAQLSGYLGDLGTGTNGTPEHVTFSVYGPFNVGDTVACTADTLAATPELVTIAANGTASTSIGFVPTAAGTYYWVARYEGDVINEPATHACGLSNEKGEVHGAQVSVEKDASSVSVNNGEDIGFDIKLKNPSAYTAKDVVITDHLPTGFDWQLNSVLTGADCSIDKTDPDHQVLTCTLASFPANTTSFVRIAHVYAATSVGQCGPVDNTASFTTGNDSGSGHDDATVTINCPDVSIAKTPLNDGPVSVGTDIGFTVTITNNGAGDATGVHLTDALPSGPGITWTVTGSTLGGNCPAKDTTVTSLTCNPTTIGAGKSVSITVKSPTSWTGTGASTVNSCAGGQKGDGVYNNEATLTVTNQAGSIDPASAHETVLCPNLTLDKTADAPAVNAGSKIGFTITLQNTGAGTATAVTLSDPLPAHLGIAWKIDSVDGPLTCQALETTITTLTCTGDLPANTSEVVHVYSDTVYASCASYPNTASVIAAGNTPQRPSDSAETSVKCANVVITKTADHTAPVNVGEDIGFTIAVENQGDGDASGVTITDTLPSGPGIHWFEDTDSGKCSITDADPQVLSCTIDALAPKGTFSVHITSHTQWTQDGDTVVNSCLGGDRDHPGTYNNQAVEQWSNGPGQIWSEWAQEVVQCPALTFTKTAADDSVDATEGISFTIAVSNSDAAGTGTAKNVTIHDPLPALTDVHWTLPADYSGPCEITGADGSQVLDCPAAGGDAIDLAPGASLSMTISSATTVSTCGLLHNVATFGVGNAPGATRSADITVHCPNLDLTKTADDESVAAGDPIGFTVAVSNTTDEQHSDVGTALNVNVSDPLPKTSNGDPAFDWKLDADYAGPCTITGEPNAQVLTCAYGNLAAGTTLTVHVSAATSYEQCGPTYTNTASLTSDNNVAVPDATASATVECTPRWHLEKSADPASGTPVEVHQTIQYTLWAWNYGRMAIEGAQAVDTLPAHVTPVLADLPAALTWDSATRTITWTLPTLAVTDDEAHKVSITFPVTVDDQNPPPATVTYPQTDDTTVPDFAPLVNVAAPVPGTGGTCITEDRCQTSHDIKQIFPNVSFACVKDAAYLHYDVTTVNVDPAITQFTATWQIPDGNGDWTDVRTDTETVGSGDLLWPGMVLNADGIAVQWPGWRQLQPSDFPLAPDAVVYGNAIEDKTLASYAYRSPMRVVFHINPTATVMALYPGVSPAGCAVPREPVLTIDKTQSVDELKSGQSFSYGISVKNVDDLAAAYPVKLSDPIPADLTVTGIETDTTADVHWNGCAVTGKNADGSGGTLNCDLSAALAPGATAPLVTLDVTVREFTADDNPGRVTNTATATYWNPSNPDAAPKSVSDTVSAPSVAGVVVTPPPTPTTTPPTTPTTTPRSPEVHVVTPLPRTGAGNVNGMLGWAAGLVGMGLVFLLGGGLRRRGFRAH